MSSESQFANKYGYPLFDTFQDENTFKHLSRIRQKIVLEAQVQDARSKMEYHFAELDKLEKIIADIQNKLEELLND